jgi:regulator of ribosome biosynthesis
VGRLFALPSEAAAVGRVAQLPPPTTVLPREKPVPKARPPTKWEVFAQRKGIVKRKRSKLEFDEGSGEYKRRHGYKKANDEMEVPWVEARAGETTGVEDPFTRMAKDKKERVKRQGKREVANAKAAVKAGGPSALPPTLRLAASLPEHGKGKPTKRADMHPELRSAARQAAGSTASMGKFDRFVTGEAAAKLRRPTGTKRKTVLPVTATKTERAQQGKLVDHILRSNADDVVSISRAIGKLDSAAHQNVGASRMKMKGANKKGRLTGGKKPEGKAKPPNAGGVRANKGGKGGKPPVKGRK